jgi:hypothetical protein
VNTFSGMTLSYPLAPASSSTSNVLLPPTKRKQSQIGGARDENEPVPVETDQKHAKQPWAAEGSPETSLPPILTVLPSGTSLGAIEAPLPPLSDTSVAPLVRPFPEMPGNSTTHHIDILVVAPPPTWLVASFSVLQIEYPNDRFEAIMRYSAVSVTTGCPCVVSPPGAPIPSKSPYPPLH